MKLNCLFKWLFFPLFRTQCSYSSFLMVVLCWNNTPRINNWQRSWLTEMVEGDKCWSGSREQLGISNTSGGCFGFPTVNAQLLPYFTNCVAQCNYFLSHFLNFLFLRFCCVSHVFMDVWEKKNNVTLHQSVFCKESRGKTAVNCAPSATEVEKNVFYTESLQSQKGVWL